MKVNGKDDIPYMKWKIKFRFQTTNQSLTQQLQDSPFPAPDGHALIDSSSSALRLSYRSEKHEEGAEFSTM